MISTDRFLENLQKISRRLVDERKWIFLVNLSGFLRSYDQGNWHSLPYDEQIYWLTMLRDMLGVRGLCEHWGMDDPVLAEVGEYLYHLIRSLQKRV